MAKKQDISSRQKEQKEAEKKLRKSERRLKDRLLATQKAQSKAIERLQRAEVHVQKVATRAKRIEERLIEVRLQLEGVRDAIGVDLVIIPPQEQQGVETVVVSDNITLFPVQNGEEEPDVVQPLHVEEVAIQPLESTQAEDYLAQTPPAALEARAVAEAAEVETRTAAERAQSANAFRTNTARPDDASRPYPEEHAGYPTPEEFARVEEITLAEENIEIATSISAAEAAGVAAANAEALAEASSARANDARLVAEQADYFLEQVRNAVRDGFIQGEEAERALNAAENEATYAHALLADAEADEERARNQAMNAEAEAEVAEGMSLSADAHARDTVTNLDGESAEHTSNGVATSSDARDEAAEHREEDEDSDPGDTAELHAIHPRESD
jgi:hypothetical protein